MTWSRVYLVYQSFIVLFRRHNSFLSGAVCCMTSRTPCQNSDWLTKHAPQNKHLYEDRSVCIDHVHSRYLCKLMFIVPDWDYNTDKCDYCRGSQQMSLSSLCVGFPERSFLHHRWWNLFSSTAVSVPSGLCCNGDALRTSFFKHPLGLSA